MSEIKSGWNYLVNARKQHWFNQGRSLCGKWMLLSVIRCQILPYSCIDCCVVCERKLAKRMQEGYESLGKSTEISA